MRSKVIDYFSKEEIPFPEGYLDIQIPAWTLIEDSYFAELKALFHQISGHLLQEEELDNPLVYTSLGLSDIHGLDDFRRWIRCDYQYKQAYKIYYSKLRPYLLAFHAESAQVIINQEEYLVFEENYIDQMRQHAADYDERLRTYAQNYLGLKGNVMTHIKEQAYEEFVFRLIANHRYSKEIEQVDELVYDTYIQKKSLEGYDPINLFHDLPFDFFRDRYGEILYNEELFDYFSNQFNFEPRNL